MAENLPAVQSPPAAEDFEAIEAAVMETARGRWFLAEYARRMRAAETTKLLEAVIRIERAMLAATAISPPVPTPAPGRIEPRVLAGPELGAAVSAVQERLSEIAWGLRERGFDERTCAHIEAQARALRDLTQARGAAAGEEGGFEPAPASTQADQASALPAAPEPSSAGAAIEDGGEAASVDETADRAGGAPVVMFPAASGPLITSLAAIDALDDRARARLFY